MRALTALVERPIGMSLIALAIMLGGGFAFSVLPVAPLPRVEFPTILVSASLPGASPDIMASAVATPLERHLGRIPGVSELTSTSTLGSSAVVLQFDLSQSMASAARAAQAAINAAQADLPANLPMRPTFRKMNPADAPMLVLALSADNRSLLELYTLAKTSLAEQLAQVEGVGEVFVGGAQQAAVRLELDLDALRARNLTLADVRARLGIVNAHQPLGSLEGGRQSFVARLDDQLLSAADYQSLVLAISDGAPVRLGDVGEAVDGVENDRSAAWFDGRRSILLFLRRQPDANVVATIDRVEAALPTFVAALPAGVQMHVAVNASRNIRASIADVEWTLIVSVLLVMVVVNLFLRDVRASSIPSIAVPLSIFGTFAGMAALGYSLDNLSLMALTIASGFVVDDAIVVTEAIMQRIERGAAPRAAARLGVEDIAFTILAITASLLAVFLPLLMMAGLVGRLFREFAMVLTMAVGISAVVSLTITPSMCAALIAPGLGAGARPGRVAAALERGYDALAQAYARALAWALARPRSMQLVTLATVVLSIGQFVTSPKGMFPSQDNGLMFVSVQGTEDCSSAALMGLHERVLQALQADPAVLHSVGFVGGDGGSTSAMAVMTLQPRELRPEGLAATSKRLGQRVSHIAGVRVFLMPSQDLRIGGRRTPTTFQYTLQSTDLPLLSRWADKVMQKLKQLPELTDVNSDQQTGGKQIALSLDRLQAAAFGLSPQSFDQAIYDAFGQRQVGVLYNEAAPKRVVLEAKQSKGATPDALRALWLAGSSSLVPLADLASSERGPAALAVAHQGQLPSITLSFNTAPGAALGDAVAAVNTAVGAMALPSEVHAEFEGTAQAFHATAASMPLLIAAALIAVYIVLGMLYESWLHPLTILSTIPSAGLGALLALRLTGNEFDIMALIGIILLIGIVKKNAIMVVDMATTLRRSGGLDARAAIEAACLGRLRPILMTTAAALLGALPLALGHGVGSELRRPLGIALVGGLCLSQLITLFTIPVVYLALEQAAAGRKKPLPSSLPVASRG